MPTNRRLPLNTIPTFRAVAELANLRAAAEVLHLTHSAVSQQIRTLEEQLGFALFDRRGRRIVLNPAGEALLRSVQSALATLDDGVQAATARNAVRFARGRRGGRGMGFARAGSLVGLAYQHGRIFAIPRGLLEA